MAKAVDEKKVEKKSGHYAWTIFECLLCEEENGEKIEIGRRGYDERDGGKREQILEAAMPVADVLAGIEQHLADEHSVKKKLKGWIPNEKKQDAMFLDFAKGGYENTVVDVFDDDPLGEDEEPISVMRKTRIVGYR